MRKPINLVLAGALAATAFASTAAAQQQASSCANPDELPVIDLSKKGSTYEEAMSTITTPRLGQAPGIVWAPDYIVDTFGKKQELTFTITWSDDGMSDYDMDIEDVASETVIATGESSEAGIETVTVEIVDCAQTEVIIKNYLGNPAQDMVLTVAN